MNQFATALSTFLIGTALIACGDSPPPPPPNTPITNDQAVPSLALPVYDVHEWGLIDVYPDQVEIGTGPGRPEPAAPAPRRKPVLYFHADDSVRINSVQVNLQGQVAEHWPATRGQNNTILWSDLTLSNGACPLAPFPSAGGAECAASPDGYCELAELQNYTTNDGSCISANGLNYDHLFYRSHRGNYRSLIRVAPNGTVQNIGLPEGRAVYLIHRDVGGTVAQAPAAGASIPLVTSGPLGAVREAISRDIRMLGLTNDEAAAFERAWYNEFFGVRNSGLPARETAPANGPARFALYFVPQNDLDNVSGLSFHPPARTVSRVIAVRIAIP